MAQDEHRVVVAAKAAADAEIAKLRNKLQVRQFSNKKKARESRQVRLAAGGCGAPPALHP